MSLFLSRIMDNFTSPLVGKKVKTRFSLENCQNSSVRESIESFLLWLDLPSFRRFKFHNDFLKLDAFSIFFHIIHIFHFSYIILFDCRVLRSLLKNGKKLFLNYLIFRTRES